MRDIDGLFLIQTETNGVCMAKPLDFDGEMDKMPAVEMKNASKELGKDVWIMDGSSEN